MNQVYLEIGDLDSLVNFILEVQKKTGLLKDISVNKVRQAMSGKVFPMQIPVDLDSVIGLAGNPVVKKIFGKKIEDTTIKYLLAAIES